MESIDDPEGISRSSTVGNFTPAKIDLAVVQEFGGHLTYHDLILESYTQSLKDVEDFLIEHVD